MIKVLSNSYARATGAMFMPTMGDDVFAFVYPELSNRMFITWFCPPLRILCFDDNGALIFDQVFNKWQFVKLPTTRLVVELDPELSFDDMIGKIAELGVDKWVSEYYPTSRAFHNAGGTPTDDPYGDLLLRLFTDSLTELKSVKIFFDGKTSLRDFKKLPLWRRGQIVCAASFVLDVAPDVPYKLPRVAIDLSRKLVQVTEAEGKNEQAEIFAAAIAGLPWTFEPTVCFRCGGASEWRQVLKSSGKIPKVSQWRLLRPENYIPLCARCESNADLFDDAELAIAFGYAYWGSRFEALHRWYKDAKAGTLPCAWNLDDFPLWPSEYGGNTWAQGSGAIQHSAPRLGKVLRKNEHLQIAREIFEHRNTRWTDFSKQGELYSLLYTNR